jgi:hypothetical protein
MRNMSIVALFVVILDTAVANAAAPACPSAVDFAATLAKAPRTVASVRSQATALDKLQAAARNDACRVQLFDRYWSFYIDMQDALATKLEPLSAAARDKKLRALGPVTWCYHDSEAGAYVSDCGDWLLAQPGKRLPAEYRDYLRLRLDDFAQGFTEDAGLLISWTELRQRLRRWEDFARRHPQFEHGDEIRGYLDVYLATLVAGTDNTRAFDSESNQLVPEVREELEAYAADPKASRGPLIREYLQLLRKSGFKWSDDVAEFIAVHDLSMQGHEPPRN